VSSNSFCHTPSPWQHLFRSLEAKQPVEKKIISLNADVRYHVHTARHMPLRWSNWTKFQQSHVRFSTLQFKYPRALRNSWQNVIRVWHLYRAWYIIHPLIFLEVVTLTKLDDQYKVWNLLSQFLYIHSLISCVQILSFGLLPPPPKTFWVHVPSFAPTSTDTAPTAILYISIFRPLKQGREEQKISNWILNLTSLWISF
jgi:hypothetical protein